MNRICAGFKRLMSDKKIQQPKWYHPSGTKPLPSLKLYNSLTKTKNEFVPINSNEVTWYSCGPTVYDASHMGHARNYVTIDVNRRILQDYFGYNVKFVQNVTDIDDKIIVRARQNYLFEQLAKKHQSLDKDLIEFAQVALDSYVKENLDLDSVDQLSSWFLSVTLSEIALTKPKVPMYYKASELASSSIEKAKLGQIEVTEFLENVKDVVVPLLDEKEGKTINDPKIFSKLPAYWEHQFDKDMDDLNVLAPSVKTRVSEYVPEIVEFVAKIVDNGYAYKTTDGLVYFKTAQFDSSEGHAYGKLQPWNKGSLELISEGEGSLSVGNAKLSPNDFALWKSSKPGEPEWDSPWGKGRPGWHIECSVMACDILGSQIDIHSGGIDLAFPHHDNELAQSEAYYNCKQWINYFLHTGHLHIEGQKMSKSLKNFITIQQALDNYSARQLRLSFALTPWNNQLDFKESFLLEVKGVESTFSKFFTNVRALNHDVKEKVAHGEFFTEKFQAKEKKLWNDFTATKALVHEAFCDNLSTGLVIKQLIELVAQTNVYLAGDRVIIRPVLDISRYISKILSIIGFEVRSDLLGWETKGETEGNDEAIKLQFAQSISKIRDEIRSLGIESKNQELLKLSDRIRDVDLLNLGISIDDRNGATGLVKVLTVEEQQQLVQQQADKLKGIQEKEAKKAQDKLLKQQQEKERLEKASIKPQDLFKDSSKYSQWDEDGVPTKDSQGEEISKSARKKLLKQWNAQKKLHELLL